VAWNVERSNHSEIAVVTTVLPVPETHLIRTNFDSAELRLGGPDIGVELAYRTEEATKFHLFCLGQIDRLNRPRLGGQFAAVCSSN